MVNAMMKARKHTLWLSIVLLTCSVASSLFADTDAKVIYKSVKPDGTIEFSDAPETKNAEKIKLSAPPVFKMPARNPNSVGDYTPEIDDSRYYQSITLTSPANNAQYRNTTEELTAKVSVAPALKSQHKVRITGAASAGPKRALSFTLPAIEQRGSHSLTAEVVDAKGKTLIKSQPITIHVQKVNAINRGR